MSGESKRQQRFAGVIQQDIADIFLKNGNAWLPGAMVTVTRVRVTPDLAIARIYLSFLAVEDKEEALHTVKKHGSDIRYKLGTKIKDQVKIIPELEFYIDDSSEYVAHMDQLFDKINKESGK